MGGSGQYYFNSIQLLTTNPSNPSASLPQMGKEAFSNSVKQLTVKLPTVNADN